MTSDLLYRGSLIFLLILFDIAHNDVIDDNNMKFKNILQMNIPETAIL